MDGPVRFLIPEGGVSASTRRASRSTIPRPTGAVRRDRAASFRAGANRRLVRLPHHINDPAFADALVAAFARSPHRAARGAPAR